VKVNVHVWKPKSTDDDSDLFAPFAAVDDARFIALRGETEEDAVDNVVGAVLCALGQKQHPPRAIEFSIKKGKPRR
jgi:hypothetical protein